MPSPSSSPEATLFHAVISISAVMAGVANTSRVPLPMAFAVLDSVTRTSSLPLIPAVSMFFPPFHKTARISARPPADSSINYFGWNCKEKGWYGIMTAKRSLYLRIPGSAFTAEDRAQMEVECPEDMP